MRGMTNKEMKKLIYPSKLQYALLLLFFFLSLTNSYARIYESPYSQEVIGIPGADNEPPVTTITISQPQYITGSDIYMSGKTEISLSAADYGIVPSGVDYSEYKINDGVWIRYSNLFTIGNYTDGLHTIYYRSIDKAGNVEDAKSITVILDKNAPLTTATLTGIKGSNGWYISDVKVDLVATDSGSGVETIKYSINGVDTAISGNSASFVLTVEGRYTIRYYAVDHLGNIEDEKSMIINIDKTLPTLTVTASPNTLWPPNHKMVNVKIDGSAVDEVSGIASVVITVKDEYGIYNMTVPGFGSTIQLEAWREGTDKDGRMYTITAVATDMAGNQSTATTVVIVPHDMRNQ